MVEFQAQPEVIAGGLPLAPEVGTLNLDWGEHTVIHGATAFVGLNPDKTYVALAIARPEFVGMYMGFTADQARSAAAWLLCAADDLDGGSGKQ